MVRPARRRSGPSYEEVKALIDEKEALKAPKILSRKQREQEERRRKRFQQMIIVIVFVVLLMK
jgi:hypothetical protein